MHTGLYHEILKKISHNIDAEFYSLHIINKNNTDQQILSNYPKKWVDIYEHHKFQKIDFVLKHSVKKNKYIWSESTKRHLNIDELNFFTLANFYGIKSGLSYYIHSTSYRGYITFANEDNLWEYKKNDYKAAQFKEKLALLSCSFKLEPKLTERHKIVLEEIYHSLYDPTATHKLQGITYKPNLSPEDNLEDALTRSLVMDVIS